MNRLHALTDGVYAIAMTLLVLEPTLQLRRVLVTSVRDRTAIR